MSARPRVVVVGAGVAGLVAARSLAARYEVVLVEREPRPGGKLATAEFRGRPLDLGPDNFLTRDGTVERLCRELGLGDDLLAPATSSAAVFARGRPRPLPRGLVLGVPTDLGALRRSGIVGPASVLRASADLVLPRGRAVATLPAGTATVGIGSGADPTVAGVVRPRLGRAVLDTLVDPLLGGINAGDAERLSFAAAAPQLAAAVTGRRSLVRSLRRGPPEGAPGGSAGHAGATARPLFLGLQGGLGSLTERLAADCERTGVELRLGVAADVLERAGPRTAATWVVRCGPQRLEADGVVLALPAYGAARLLRAVAPDLAQACGTITYAGVVTVTLAWPGQAVPGRIAALLAPRRAGTTVPRAPAPSSSGTASVLPGSGVLVPRSSGHLVTAATFTSTKWPRSANPGEAVVRASAGRDGDDRALSLGDDELVTRVRTELGSILGITSPPLETLVQRWPMSFPQYVSGHLAQVRRIAALAAALPGLALAGAGYEGIGIPACVASGHRAASAIDVQLSG